MNIERILKLADHLESSELLRFDMRYTALCIIGHAERLFGLDGWEALFDNTEDDFVLARLLFHPTYISGPDNPYGATRQQGAKVLRILAETKQVNWKASMQ